MSSNFFKNYIAYTMFACKSYICIHTYIHMYHRTNVLCCKKRSSQKKKYSNSKVRVENIAVVFIQLWSLQPKKFLLLPSSRWWRGVCVWADCLTHACHNRSVAADWGRTGRASGTFNAPVLTTAFNSAKISILVFLYRDFGEQIEDSRMFDVTSETLVKHLWLF